MKNVVAKDSRSYKAKESFYRKLKKRYCLRVSKRKRSCNKVLILLIFQELESSKADKLNKELLTIADKKYTKKILQFLESPKLVV